MFSLFRGRRAETNQRLIETLHERIVTAARHPVFYIDYGVADTFEGRFEVLALLASLALRRLNDAEAPGPAVAQDLVDAIFRHLDWGLREIGVGDMAVPKRIKKLAEAFLGRSAAYTAALATGENALAEALSRNIYGGIGDGRPMARYATETWRRLIECPLDDCLRRGFPFPDPATLASGDR